jgi:hypothetical protein
MDVLGSIVDEKAVQDRRDERARKARVERAKSDFGFFAQTYLSDYFFTDSAAYQKILYDVADTRALRPETAEALKTYVREKYQPLLVPNDNLSGAMFIEPREHGKTVRWSFAYPLWRIINGSVKYILLIGATQTAAEENLINLRTEIEENEKLLEDFGELRGDRWSDSRIELSIGACIQAKGAGMSMRGTRYRQYRPDLIILDDILKDDAVESPTVRAKIHRWLKRVVFNLGKTAFIVWVNTIFHSDDPISRLMDELERGTLKRWIAVRLSCFRPDGEPLWPENWPKDVLEEKREQLGADVFSTEYENEPLSDEERIIKREWIEVHWYTPTLRPPLSDLRTFLGVDPATGKHDGTGMASIGVDSKGILWELDSWAETVSENTTVTQMITKHEAFGYELIGWEEVTFSGIYANLVMSRAAESGIYLPIKKIPAMRGGKDATWRFLSPLIENGIIRLREKGAGKLIDQLTNYPKWKFDDLGDALGLAVRIARTGPGAPIIAPIIRQTLKSARTVLRGFRHE